MLLYLLLPTEAGIFDEKSQSYRQTYDCATGFVVRAETEAGARKLAQEQTGYESDECNWTTALVPQKREAVAYWIDPKMSTCEIIGTASGFQSNVPEVVLRDYRAG